MRGLLLLTLAAGCGFQVGAGTPGSGDDVLPPDARPDTPGGHDVPPRLIPGGGIGDAPIDGVLNVYAIDWITGAPILGATIDVGDTSGATDSTGLVVVRAASLAGKQTVLATAPGYRAEEWVGVTGANVTLAMHPLTATVPHVDVAGTFASFSTGLPGTPTGHSRVGSVGYSQGDGLADPWNNIKTAANANRCTGTTTCAFTVSTRPGHVALLGTTYDYDPRNPTDPNDDVYTFQTYSYKTGLVLDASTTAASVMLTQIPAAQLVTLAVDRGTVPPGTTGFFAVAGIDLPDDGAWYLSQIITTQTAMIKAPPLSLFPGAQYRVAGVAASSGSLSVLVRRGLGTATALDMGTWLVPASVTAASRTGATWTPAADATFSGALVSVPMGAEVLNVLAFDGTTTVTWPSRVALPASVQVTANEQRGTIDVADLSFARDAAKIDAYANSAPSPAP